MILQIKRVLNWLQLGRLLFEAPQTVFSELEIFYRCPRFLRRLSSWEGVSLGSITEADLVLWVEVHELLHFLPLLVFEIPQLLKKLLSFKVVVDWQWMIRRALGVLVLKIFSGLSPTDAL